MPGYPGRPDELTSGLLRRAVGRLNKAGQRQVRNFRNIGVGETAVAAGAFAGCQPPY